MSHRGGRKGGKYWKGYCIFWIFWSRTSVFQRRETSWNCRKIKKNYLGIFLCFNFCVAVPFRSSVRLAEPASPLAHHRRKSRPFWQCDCWNRVHETQFQVVFPFFVLQKDGRIQRNTHRFSDDRHDFAVRKHEGYTECRVHWDAAKRIARSERAREWDGGRGAVELDRRQFEGV